VPDHLDLVDARVLWRTCIRLDPGYQILMSRKA